MKKISARILNWIVICLSSLIILVAVLLLLLRGIIFFANEYRQPLETWVSQTLDLPLTIEKVDVHWDHFDPVIIFSNVAIINAGQTRLTIEKLSVRIDFFKSISTRSIQPRTVIVQGAHLSIEQKPTGGFNVVGFNINQNATDNSSPNGILEWLGREREITLQDINIDYKNKKGVTIPIRNIQVILENQPNAHHLVGQAEIAKGHPAELYFIVHINGALTQLNQSDVQAYFQASQINLEDWFPNLHVSDLILNDGQLALQAWVNTSAGKLKNTAVVFSLKNLNVTTEEAQSTGANYTVPEFSGQVFLLPWGSGWQWFSNAMQLTLQNMSLPVSQLLMGYDHNKIVVQNLSVDNGNLSGSAQGVITLPTDNEPANTNLTIHYNYRDITQLKDHLPEKLMPEALTAWLKQAFVGADPVSGQIHVAGDLSKFPFPHNEGEFDASVIFKNGTVSYEPGWPLLTGAVGRVDFHNNGMILNLDQAAYHQTSLRKVQAVIPAFVTPGPVVLTVQGRAWSNLSDAIRFINESPLRPTGVNLTEWVEASGPAALHFKISLPVSEPNPHVDVNAEVAVQQGTLLIKPINLPISNINGRLSFTEDTVTAQNIQSQLLGHPFSVNIRSSQPNYIDVTGVGTLDPQQLKDRVDLQNLMQGTAPFNLHLGMPLSAARHQAMQLTLSTDFKGIAINVPAPIGKTSAQTQPSHIDFDFSSPDGIAFAFRYGALLNGVMKFKDQHDTLAFYSGAIHFGPDLAQQQKEPGLLIDGAINSLDVSAWQTTLSGLKKTETSKTSASSQNPALLRRVDLYFNQLKAAGLSFNQMRVTANRGGNAWLINLNNPTVLGLIQYPDTFPNQPLVLNFQKLTVPSMSNGSSSKTSSLKPQSVPPIDFSAQSLIYGKTNLQNVRVILKPIPNGVQIQQLTTSQPSFNVTAHGQWVTQGTGSQTTLTGQLQSPNYGDMIKTLNLTQNIEGQNALLVFNLNWPGSPAAVTAKTLSGTAQLDLGPGRIVDVGSHESDVALGKLLTLFSIQNLVQRFKLNFEQGYPFNEMHGNFVFSHGILSIPNAYMDGTVARLEWSGLINFVRNNYDITLLVTPHLTSSLPMLVTVAGTAVAGPVGLLAGAATWAVTKMASSQIAKATTYTYKVTGSLDNPTVTEVKS